MASLQSQTSLPARIFAPIAYRSVREMQIVPVVHVEALALASWFPVVWRAGPNGHELVALRTLLSDGRGQPSGSPRHPRSLPLALRAFPFRLGDPNDALRSSIVVDHEFADAPTDVGAPLIGSDGKLSRGSDYKCRALSAFAHSQPLTMAMTRDLEARDLLVPWPLDFEVGPRQRARVEGLNYITADEGRAGDLCAFVARFGAEGAELVGGHRLSLFRAGILLAAARTAVSRDVASHARPAEAVA